MRVKSAVKLPKLMPVTNYDLLSVVDRHNRGYDTPYKQELIPHFRALSSKRADVKKPSYWHETTLFINLERVRIF